MRRAPRILLCTLVVAACALGHRANRRRALDPFILPKPPPPEICASDEPAHIRGCRLTCVVLDLEGNPVGGALVSVVREGEDEVRWMHADEGVGEIDLRPGRYRVRAGDEPWSYEGIDEVRIEIIAGGTDPRCTVRVRPVPPPAPRYGSLRRRI